MTETGLLLYNSNTSYPFLGNLRLLISVMFCVVYSRWLIARSTAKDARLVRTSASARAIFLYRDI